VIAIEAPVRVPVVVVMPPVEGTGIVRVHAIIMDVPFINPE
jgi:hypothetical protein